MNLQELMNLQHQKSSECVQRLEHTVISTTGCVTQATSKKEWQPYAHEDYRSTYIYTPGEAREHLRDLNPYLEANSTAE